MVEDYRSVMADVAHPSYITRSDDVGCNNELVAYARHLFGATHTMQMTCWTRNDRTKKENFYKRDTQERQKARR